jgi:hypothetical protein
MATGEEYQTVEMLEIRKKAFHVCRSLSINQEKHKMNEILGNIKYQSIRLEKSGESG